MQSKPFTPDGPIPGENYTSDTRNYPWHRPPEITDLDKGIEASIKQLTQHESAVALLTMLQSGVTVVQATDIFLTSGMAKGKWTVDFALLLAGPISHMIKLMAEGYGIKYDMGLEDKKRSTISFIKAKAIDPAKAVDVAEDVMGAEQQIKDQAASQPTPGAAPTGQPAMAPEAPPSPAGGGFMGMPAPQEQGMM